MAGDTEERFWTAEELEILVQYIQEPDNQKGSGLTKKAALVLPPALLIQKHHQVISQSFWMS
jgi:hypothetical protein